MKTADMLSLFFSFCDFIGIVTGLKIDPIDHIKKKAIELPLKEFEKWKKNSTIFTRVLPATSAPSPHASLCAGTCS